MWIYLGSFNWRKPLFLLSSSESWPLVILLHCPSLWQGDRIHWESANICRWSMPVVYMLKSSWCSSYFSWQTCENYHKSANDNNILTYLFFTLCSCTYCIFSSEPEFVSDDYYWPVYLIKCVCGSVSITPLQNRWRLLKKGKVYENNRQIICVQTHTYTCWHISSSLLVRRPFV